MAMAGSIASPVLLLLHRSTVSRIRSSSSSSSSPSSSSSNNRCNGCGTKLGPIVGRASFCASLKGGDGELSTPVRGLPLLQTRPSQQQQQSRRWGCSRSSIGCFRVQRPGRRRRVSISCGELPMTAPVTDEPSVAELPCLPFTPAEVFVPSSTKVLHLYEARFLALLEEVVGKYDNLFAHIVIEPMGPRGEDEESNGVASFLATYGCLARVEKVKRLDIGAEVTIRGIGRIKLIGLTQLEPFLKGTVISLKDGAPKDAEELGRAIEELRTTLSTVQQLQIKLKVSSDELLQTPLERALQWADKGEPDQAAKSYLPSREERVSFAALQPVVGSSAAEQHKLLQERLFAMEAMDTLLRLSRVKHFNQQTVASLAAKVSIQSLNL